MTESSTARVVRRLRSKLKTMRTDGDDPTLRDNWNCFALLGIDETERPERVPELALAAKTVAETELRKIESDRTLATITSDFKSLFTAAHTRLKDAVGVRAHLDEIRGRRRNALRESLEGMTRAGLKRDDPALRTMLLSRAEQLGYPTAQREPAVAGLLGGVGSGSGAKPSGRDEPEHKKPAARPRNPRSKRPGLGLAGVFSFAPLAVSGTVTALAYALALGHVEAPKQLALLTQPPTVAAASAPGEAKPEPVRGPVIRDVTVDVAPGATRAKVRFVVDTAASEKLQFKYRKAGSAAWKNCQAEVSIPLSEFEMEFEFQVTDSTRAHSEIVKRTLPAIVFRD